MKTFKKTLYFLFLVIMVTSLVACGDNTVVKSSETNDYADAESFENALNNGENLEEKIVQEIIDYADAESFENALNNGENLEGKIVQFVAGELHPNSTYGYNIWAGEHLNFVSSRNPDVKEGDTVIVKTTIIESTLGSWIIEYEKVDNAIIDDSTISSESSSSSSSESTNHSGTNGTNNGSFRVPDSQTSSGNVNSISNGNSFDADKAISQLGTEGFFYKTRFSN